MSNTNILWDNDEPVTELGINVPAWINQDITPYDIAAIAQGGCESGAYMPAVTYWMARDTMNEHGDDVLQYIEDMYDDIPPIPAGTSWSGIAVYYLSMAVELWAGSVKEEIAEILEALLSESEATSEPVGEVMGKDTQMTPSDAVEFFRAHSAWLAESWEMSPEGREYKRKFDAAILCLEIALAKEK